MPDKSNDVRREADRRGRAFVIAMRIYVRGIVREESKQRLRSSRRQIAVPHPTGSFLLSFFFLRRSENTSD